jgi:hypothetical protein
MAGKNFAVIDFGATPVAEKQFTITDALISSTTIVEPFVQILATGDNDVSSHRHAAASWKLVAEAGTGSFLLDVTCLIDMCHGTFNIQYAYA